MVVNQTKVYNSHSLIKISMSQIVEYHPPSSIQPSKVSIDVITSTISASDKHLLKLNEDFIVEIEKPVKIINDQIEVNENLMEEGHIYHLTYRGEDYYLRKSKGITEFFQLKE